VGVGKAACARESLETVRSVEVIRTADHCLKSLSDPLLAFSKGSCTVNLLYLMVLLLLFVISNALVSSLSNYCHSISY
jgi:hypothetical protein